MVSKKESRWAGVGLARLCHGDRDGSCLHCCHVELLLFLQNTVFERSHDIIVEFSLPEALFFCCFFKNLFCELAQKVEHKNLANPSMQQCHWEFKFEALHIVS